MKDLLNEFNSFFESDKELLGRLDQIKISEKITFENIYQNFVLMNELIPKSKKYL
jgi:hypothetical protein